MKKQLVTSFAIISLITSGLTHAANVPNGHVTIHIKGIQQIQGQAIFVLMDSQSSHHGDTPVYSKTIKPVNSLLSKAEFDLPAGEYSAVVYHDVNANGKLDTGFFGKPTEPYGFSNDARNAFGIPSFEESRFVVGSGNSKLDITVE